MDANISFVKQTPVINTYLARHCKKIQKAQYDKAGFMARYQTAIANPSDDYLDDWYLILFDSQQEPQAELKEKYRKKILTSLAKKQYSLLRVNEHFYIHCDGTVEELASIRSSVQAYCDADYEKRRAARVKAGTKKR
jgi:hypothetical protein